VFIYLIAATTEAERELASKALESARCRTHHLAVELAKVNRREISLQLAIDTWMSASRKRFSSFIRVREERLARSHDLDAELADLQQRIESRTKVRLDLMNQLRTIEAGICDINLKIPGLAASYARKKKHFTGLQDEEASLDKRIKDLTNANAVRLAENETLLSELLLSSNSLDTQIQASEKALKVFPVSKEPEVGRSASSMSPAIQAAPATSVPMMSHAARSSNKEGPDFEALSSKIVKPGPGSKTLYPPRRTISFGSVLGIILADEEGPAVIPTEPPASPAHLLRRRQNEAGPSGMSSSLPRKRKLKHNGDSSSLPSVVLPCASSLPRIPKKIRNVDSVRIVHQVLASQVFGRPNEQRVVEGKKPSGTEFNLLIVTDEVGMKTCLGAPTDSFFGRIDPHSAELVGVPGQVVNCSESLQSLGVRIWHVGIQGLCVHFSTDDRLCISNRKFLPRLRRLLGVAEDFPFDGILALVGANDAVNLVISKFMDRWKRTKDAFVPTTFDGLTDFVLEQMKYWADLEERVIGYLGAGSMPALQIAKALGRDLLCNSSVQPFVFHLNTKVETHRQEQLHVAHEAPLKVAFLPLPIYDDEAFSKLCDATGVRRTLKVDAYSMFVGDVLNRGAVYMSHLLRSDEEYEATVFACAGALPTSKIDGSDVVAGKNPKEAHVHNGISCTGPRLPAHGLATELSFPIEQKVSFFSSFVLIIPKQVY
jgi:hypothetical protein